MSSPSVPLRAILVFGATGRQGSALINALLSSPGIESKHTILAVTRDPSTPRAQKLIQSERSRRIIKVIKGNLNSPSEIFRQARELSPSGDNKVWGVFSMQDKDPKIYPNYLDSPEVKQAFGLIDESIKNGVEYYVYTSGDRGGNDRSWENPTTVPHFKTKYHIERYLLDQIKEQNSSMRWTIFRPTMFYENLQPTFDIKIFMTAYRDILRNKKCQWISTVDIGVFVSKAFLTPEEYYGRAISLAGDEFTFEELDEKFRKVTGKGVPVTFGVLGKTLGLAARDYQLMLECFRDDGYGADIEECRRIHPGMMGVEEWLRERSGYTKI
ncbi:hypothetical protein I302_101607 [Kwoniella bestiolae CBS 10118]|uniref:NmrA-like domain-containing protein n=1 Tax=Kwoniella bestiolae CBS 10118 TaxID=1296100 RepID=A0A1B9GCQ2_9TREE|nr:hypothetical protein I302_00288 [Kwoniella bestiolae CBS 10118]OCF28799.1 hypothetical protein I302_00288 [Kwoniella bestiolae CBS 10118]